MLNIKNHSLKTNFFHIFAKKLTIMNKKEAIEQLRKAKLAHKKWISYAKAIHMGIPIQKESFPVIETECDFGK